MYLSVNFMNTKIFLMLTMTALMLFGCFGPAEEEVVVQPESEPEPQPAPQPSFTVVSPYDGQVFETTEDTTDIQVVLSTFNLILKAPAGSPEAGEGHFHLILDGGAPIVVSSKEYTLVGVGEGEHSLTVQLMNNDHTPYSPSVMETVTFTIQKKAVEVEHATHQISVHDFELEPYELTIKSGDIVKFLNIGSYPRTFSSPGNFQTETMAPGESTSVTLDIPGEFEYFASEYPPMKGKIIVEE